MPFHRLRAIPAVVLSLSLYSAALMAISVDPPMTDAIAWPDARFNLRRARKPAPEVPAGPRFDAPSGAAFNPGSKMVQACSTLKNPLDKPITVNYTSITPLILLPEEGDALKRRPRAAGEPPLPPPAPPLPMLFDVPARSSVRFCAESSLADFDYKPDSEARIRWHFGWINPPAGRVDPLQGVLMLNLK